MRKHGNLRLYLAALVLFLGGTGTLAYVAMTEAATYHLQVTELLDLPPQDIHALRISGMVAEDGVQNLEGNGVRFLLADNDHPDRVVPSVYRGVVPDGFKPGAEVILEGSYRQDEAVITVDSLMTKCPSKYKKENRT